MRKNRLNAIIALLLIFCMMLSSCSLFDFSDEEANADCLHENTVIENQKEATCLAKGYTGDTVCTECDKVITPGEEIAIGNHVYDDGTITKEPTCIEGGISTHECVICGTTKIEHVDTVAHSDEYHDLQDGKHQHTCLVCTMDENEEHTPVDEGKFVAATCLEAAYTEHTCSLCGGVYKLYSESELALGDHIFTDWTTEDPSCTAAGQRTRTCTREGCGHVDVIAIPISDVHFYKFSKYITAPNCQNDGVAEYKCDSCGDTMEKVIAKNGLHVYGPATATTTGFLTKSCTVCGYEVASYNASNSLSAAITTDIIDKDKALEMNMKEAAIQFPSDVVSQITNGANLEISAGVLDSATKENVLNSVTDEEKALLENATIYDFTVKVDNEIFTSNFSQKVTVTVKYEIGDDDPEGIVIYYIAENGEIQEITDVVYNEETEEITFMVEHFSHYAKATEETQAMRCRRGNHEYVKTSETVSATCYQFGHTVYECSYCHNTTVDDIVERLPHDYGQLIQAAPTCEKGDYSKRICRNEGCGNILTIEFVGALGHKMDKPATCDAPSKCTNEGCGKILSSGDGHDFTDWETVTRPTDISAGLRKRTCIRCGTEETSSISSTGNISAIEYESYSELFDILLSDFLNISSGEFEFRTVYNGNEAIEASARVMKTQDGYRISITGKRIVYYTADRDAVNWSDEFEFYYENGAFIVIDDGVHGTASDIDYLVPVAFDIAKAVASELHTYLDEYVNANLKEVKAFVAEYKELLGDDINAILEKADVPYTVDTIDDFISSVESVYAYLSIKLGFETSAQIRDDVSIPTAEEIAAVLGAFMQSDEKDGITTYSLSSAPITEATAKIVQYFEKQLNKSVATFIYSIIGTRIFLYNPTITSFDKLIDHFAAEFPGTFSVADAVTRYISLTEKNPQLPSLEELYALADNLALTVIGKEISTEEIISQNSGKTLDDLALLLTGNENSTIAEIYDSIKKFASENTLGDLSYNGVTLRQIVSKLSEIANGDFGADISFSVDANDRFAGLSINNNLWTLIGSEFVSVQSLYVSVKHSNNVQINVPEELKPLLIDVECYYDENGNLIIKGLDTAADYDFGVVGNGKIGLDDTLIKDEDTSSLYGYDVYIPENQYWTENKEVGTYILYEGNYYLPNYTTHSFIEPTASAVWKEFINRLYNIPENLDYPIGYLIGTEIPVYSFSLADSNIGILYQKDGVWTVSTRYSNAYVNGEIGYYVADEYVFENFVKTVRLGMTMKSYVYDYALIGGIYRELVSVTVEFGTEGRTTNLLGVYLNDSLQIITDYRGSYDLNIFNFSEPVANLPRHSYTKEYNTTVTFFEEEGIAARADAQKITLHEKLPTYYIRVADGIYSLLNSRYIYTKFDTTDLETLALTDGNTLYVIGSTMENSYGYEYGYETVYGFAKTQSGVYIQTAALVKNDTIIEIRYRGIEEDKHADLSEMYDLEEFIIASDNGTYKIPAELIEELKELCKGEGSSFAFRIEASRTVNDKEITLIYNVGAYTQMPDIDMDDILGKDDEIIDDTDFWYNLFGSIGENSTHYEISVNEDGSITLTFDHGSSIKNLGYSANSKLPIEDIITENPGHYSGLDMYYYQGYATYSDYYEYIYENGKYYTYNLVDTYDLRLSDDYEFAKAWYISDTWYQFDMVGDDELPDGIPVYNTTIRFDYDYAAHGGSQSITLYTFFLDGVLNVAVEAETTGHSMLKFEGYMPIDEYMDSLRFELGDGSHYDTIYYRDETIDVYYAYFSIFETDGQGNKLGTSAKYQNQITYIIEDGEEKYIKNYYRIRTNLELSANPADISHVPADATVNKSTVTYYNGTFTRVTFTYEVTIQQSTEFVKIAGILYRYDSYTWERMSEEQFEKEALNTVWYFMVENTSTGERTFYNDYIPSDTGFAPAGDIIDEGSIIGTFKEQNLLGYTAEGYPLYEMYYIADPDAENSGWNEEVIDEKTVFLQKSGVGYLQIKESQANYYVKAHKVSMSDGSEQIYCNIDEAVLYGSEANGNNAPFFGEYIIADGRTLTFTADFLELIRGNNRNNFYIDVNLADPNASWTLSLSYYDIESFFMMPYAQ